MNKFTVRRYAPDLITETVEADMMQIFEGVVEFLTLGEQGPPRNTPVLIFPLVYLLDIRPA